MKLIELRCKSCGAPLTPESVSTALAIARCPHCDAVFALVPARTDMPVNDSRAIPRHSVPMPRRFQILDLGSSLEIKHTWFSPVLFFLVFFCVFWNGFMLVWHGIAIATGTWIMSCFGLIHTLVGIGLAYGTIAGFVNQTVIRVGQGLLEVRHGPLPWFGNKTFPTPQIKQLYCKEHVHHGKNGSSTTYSVEILLDNNREMLVRQLPECEQALYIEQEIERFLRIEDRPIRGELPR